MSESKRIQFDFPPETWERLEKLKVDTKSKSYAEVIRDSIRFYEWKVKSTMEGYDIGLVDKDQNLVKIIQFIL